MTENPSGGSIGPKYTTDSSIIKPHLDAQGHPSSPLSSDEWAQLNDDQRSEWWWSLDANQRAAQNGQLTIQEQKDWNKHLFDEKFQWPEGAPHNMRGMLENAEVRRAFNASLENAIVSNYGKFQQHEKKVARAMKASTEGGDPSDAYL